MKKFIYGLLIMLFAFSALPVLANVPTDGHKKEIKTAVTADFDALVQVSNEIAQVQFVKISRYSTAELQHYSLQKTPADLNTSNFKSTSLHNWHFLKFDNTVVNQNCIHIDPGNLFCC